MKAGESDPRHNGHMDLYARVNILEGRSVRLTHGDLREVVALDADPVGRCLSWERLGIDYLHVVDLDAAIRKDYRNRALIDDILHAVKLPVQVAGGIRSEQELERLIKAGAWRVVMGTAAIENQNMVWEACRTFPDKVVVAVDVLSDGEVVTGGWTGHSGRFLEEVLVEMSSAGAAAFLVGEAHRDALTEPPGFAMLAEALSAVEEPVIASGGVRDLSDLVTLLRLRVGTRQHFGGGRGSRGDGGKIHSRRGAQGHDRGGPEPFPGAGQWAPGVAQGFRLRPQCRVLREDPGLPTPDGVERRLGIRRRARSLEW